jgi:hypothetical protein
MSAAIIGNLPQGKILVTDGMVASTANVTSHRDCKLKDKIFTGSTIHGYYSLVGDETILYGIQFLDAWSLQNGMHFDFTDEASLKLALAAAEKIIQVYKHIGDIKNDCLYPDLSYVYMISDQKVINYYISRHDNKYRIERCKLINDNEIILNYGGHIHAVSALIFQNVAPADCIDVAANYLQQHHAQSVARSKPHLQYEFDNRFCGVLIPGEGKDFTKLPFRTFDEYIITMCGGGWDLMDSPPF